MLLDELITALSDEKESLAGILLRTKVFMHQIGKKDLADWVVHELNGYPSAEFVPGYRRLQSSVKANVRSMTLKATSFPMPTFHLSPELRSFCEAAVITQSISQIQMWCDGESGHLTRQVPMEANGEFAKVLNPGCYVDNAWCETPIADVCNILFQVRSRLLDFILELKDGVGEAESAEEVKKKVGAIDANTMFQNAVFGPNTIISIGNHTSSITATQTQNSEEFANSVKSFVAQLAAALPSAGFPEVIKAQAEAGLAELEEAAHQDKPNVARIRSGLEALKHIFEHVAGHLIAAGALSTIGSLLGGPMH